MYHVARLSDFNKAALSRFDAKANTEDFNTKV